MIGGIGIMDEVTQDEVNDASALLRLIEAREKGLIEGGPEDIDVELLRETIDRGFALGISPDEDVVAGIISEWMVDG